jgi:hypothetical protein
MEDDMGFTDTLNKTIKKNNKLIKVAKIEKDMEYKKNELDTMLNWDAMAVALKHMKMKYGRTI